MLEQYEIDAMTQEGWAYKLDPRMGAQFQRGEIHIWRIPRHDEHQHFVGMRWQTAKLIDGYYREHMPMNDLFEVRKAFPRVYAPLREIRVTWESGEVATYNMAAGLTDAEMLAYYRPGNSFNVGDGILDHFDTVVASEVLK